MIFTRHMKALGAWSYYNSMQFDIQHWIQVSVECDVPAALTPPPPCRTLSRLTESPKCETETANRIQTGSLTVPAEG